MFASWKEAFQNKRFLIYFLLCVMGLIAFALYLPYFFNYVLLHKRGQQLDDPILNLFSPRDWSIEIFILIYSCTLIFFISNLSSPKIILLTLQSYVLVNFMRIACLFLFTLEAPEGIIPLADPFLAVFAYQQEVFVKDLFFSGHVSTLMVFFLIERRRLLKWIIFFSAILVGIGLAWQRVHYSIDMIAAVLFSIMVVHLFRFINRDL
ncbi:MAG: hypothetical protein JST43_05445 [Bacteroidetes bacterium]|nr:hypothetical protein [Bacteroidota bacterium]MBS1539235.1 hypothetical protein [Bacteroidota bacterium]